MTVDFFALRLASAAAAGGWHPPAGVWLIGKDTRLSGYLFESALRGGFRRRRRRCDADRTSAHARHRLHDAAARVQFSASSSSASHNSYEDNGIKFFDATGSKLSDEIETLIETVDRPARHHAGIAAPRQGGSHRPQQDAIPGILRIDHSRRNESERFSKSSSTAPTARVQGRSARARGSRRGNRAHRLAHPTAATSTTVAVRPHPSCCSSPSPGCGLKWAWRSTGMATGV